jgi:uncharacterized protein (DUF2225 family)
MDNVSYTSKITCPVCQSKIEITKIRSSSLRMIKRDEDFCTYYEPINPVLYNVIVCSECGYSAMDDKFEGISDKDIKVIKENVMPRWTKRDFFGERDINKAIEAYKLALLNLQMRKAKNSELAKVCLRVAWLYRFLNDKKEEVFLKYALDSYNEAFKTENLPSEGLDEQTCIYMIGELSRRLGMNQEALKWFYMVISNDKRPQDKTGNDADAKKRQSKSNMLVEMARNQMQLIKEEK